MSSGRFFENASYIKLHGGQSFANANNIINNYNCPTRAELEPASGSSSCRRDDGQWLTLKRGGQRLRWIDMCDMLTLREVSSETLCVSVKLKSTNPFRNRVKNVVKIQKRIQSAEFFPGFGDRRFTVVSLEPENSEGDLEKIQRVLEPLYEAALSRHRVGVTQLFGVGRSTIPTLIYHDEVVNVNTLIRQYSNSLIVRLYLAYRLLHSIYDVLDDEAPKPISLSNEMREWTFNLRTGSFQYDVITRTLSGEDSLVVRYFDQLLPFPRDCNPPLDSNEIIRAFPDILHIVSSFGGRIKAAKCICHDLVIFGIVIDCTTRRILGYFPSVSSPVWSCKHSVGIPNIVANYSNSVPSLVDLAFMKENNIWQMDLRFSLSLPPEDRQQLRTAYLVQSFPFYNNHKDSRHLVCIDEFRVYLTATFTCDLSTCDPPKYLHVPPLSPVWINNMPCVYDPLNTQFFYWSFDRSGKTAIPKDDWAKYGIPELKVHTDIGSCWSERPYTAVQEYLRSKNYDFQSGQRFANDHGYPILVKGNPHIRAEKHLKSKLQKTATLFPDPNSSGKKGKGKEKARGPNSQVDTQAGRVGQPSIVEIPD
ncbi:hypothetical protein E1B28_010590 [Marasmius oreades]|uniref:Uncharacterized protein n=1 Tax=Marasmius oreades TaxID=181124 RepID=A0A9P7UTT7_9AGAR|nr:uncharacterized protein E1B28_010590 [Marasmius oreades]KAG7091564.1 hypothetical protein E1B28_010590 [Marasmius oreades]